VTAGTAEVVIATKLFAPSSRQQPVARQRLYEGLHAGVTRPLTIVVAPAGWGKTTLLVEWLKQERVDAGWFALDRGDDDVKRFWRYLLLAANRARDEVGTPALSRLDAAGSDVVRDVVPVFVNDLATSEHDVVVVLDDYHLVGNSQVHESIAMLLDRCPPQLHLVLSTRADPPMPLSRLRVRGNLVEVRADQLRFTVDEAADMLNRGLGLALAPQDVQRLVARTEGWAAGLQLAALRLADQPDRSAFIERFTGADRHVVDNLGEEVLASQPEHVRDFLLSTSVLNRLCGSLAQALTDRADAAEILDGIYRANLFLTPLDDEGLWFRYHHLFRGILRHELTRVAPGRSAALHRRAAEWYAGSGDLSEAVGHALDSGDTGLAGELIARGWRQQFNVGHLQTVHRWLDALPSDLLAGDVQLSVAQIWLALDGGRLDEAGASLAAAEQHAWRDAHLQVLRALLTYKAGDVAGADRLLRDVTRPAADAFVVTVHSLLTGVTAWWLDEPARAGDPLRDAVALAMGDGNRLARIYALGCLALLAVEGGDLDAGVALLADTEPDAAETVHFVAMFPALAQARLAAARADWDDASRTAVRAVELSRRGAGRVEVAAALLTAASVARKAAAGTEQAARWLSEARAVLAQCVNAGPVVSRWLAAEERALRSSPPTRAVAEPLTERELAILRLLPGPMSQRQLATSLFVTPNTLKTHLRAIYRKLGADSRGAAVSRARGLGLI
jgi:LuxR family maltose regulon positive regulatory protein